MQWIAPSEKDGATRLLSGQIAVDAMAQRIVP